MLKFFLVIILIVIILLIISRKNNKIFNKSKSNIYKKISIVIFILGILFLIATSGKFIIPQLMQIIKVFLPLITRFIGI